MDIKTRKPILEGVALEAALARLQKIRDDLPDNEYARQATLNAEMELLYGLPQPIFGDQIIYDSDSPSGYINRLAIWRWFVLAYAAWFIVLLLLGLSNSDLLILFFAISFPITLLVGGTIFVRLMH